MTIPLLGYWLFEKILHLTYINQLLTLVSVQQLITDHHVKIFFNANA